MRIQRNPYLGPDHWAFRLLACPQDRLENLQQLTRAFRGYRSAVLFPEQLLSNARIHTHSHGGDQSVVHKVWGVECDAHASGVDLKIRHHRFEQVRILGPMGGRGRASHVPKTVMQWDMEYNQTSEPAAVAVTYKSRAYDASGDIKLHEYLPWLTSWHRNKFSMHMLFGERQDAYRYAQQMMYIRSHMYPEDVSLRGQDRLDWFRMMA